MLGQPILTFSFLTLRINKAAGECSFSSSYIEVLMSKARKKKLEEVSWIVLLFEYEYSPKVSGVDKDNYMTFLGAFDYDDGADNLLTYFYILICRDH